MGPQPSRSAVRDTYDRIADHFAETRQHSWPAVETFLESRSDGSKGLAIGAGNGRHLTHLEERVDRVLALDISAALIRIGRERVSTPRVDWIRGDAVTLPIHSNQIDVGLYIATLHHLPSLQERNRSLTELDRVLTRGGHALVSVWATSHSKFEFESARDTTVSWTLPDGSVVERYYHIYDRPTFRTELTSAPLEVCDIFEEAGNLFAVVRSTTTDARAGNRAQDLRVNFTLGVYNHRIGRSSKFTVGRFHR